MSRKPKRLKRATVASGCVIIRHARLDDPPVRARLSSAAVLSSQGAKQVLCGVHLVPIRGGLLALPRLDVTVLADRDSSGQEDVSGVAGALSTALLVQSFPFV